MPIAYIHKTGTVFEKKMEKRERLGGGVYLEGTLAVVASEASFVVNALVCCQPINRIHSFITSSTFLGCSNKCHFIIYIFLRPPLQKKVTPNKTGEELRTLFIFQLKLRTARFLFSFSSLVLSSSLSSAVPSAIASSSSSPPFWFWPLRIVAFVWKYINAEREERHKFWIAVICGCRSFLSFDYYFSEFQAVRVYYIHNTLKYTYT